MARLVAAIEPARYAVRRRTLPGEWAQLRHAELERLIGRARLSAATALLEAGDWMAAADAAAEAAERDPYDEAVLRVLLRAHVMGGRVAGALAAYASARERMADELGVDPSPETSALYTAILRGEVTPPARPSPAGPGLVGRDDELAYLEAVAARARGGPAEVLVVDGEAGIGKTTLLRAWADRRGACGDTVLRASCGPLDRSLPLDALLAALAALLRELEPEATAEILGADTAILAPLVNMAAGPRPLPMLADSMLGPAVLYSALVRALGRLAERAPLVIVVDDAHLAGPALADWLRFVRREDAAVTVVAAVRSGEGEPLPATASLHLDALGRDAAAELVGAARVDEPYARSGGHPLFLTELAQQAAGAELPASLVESARGPGSPRRGRCSTVTWSSAGGCASGTSSSPDGWPFWTATRSARSPRPATWRPAAPHVAAGDRRGLDRRQELLYHGLACHGRLLLLLVMRSSCPRGFAARLQPAGIVLPGDNGGMPLTGVLPGNLPRQLTQLYRQGG